MFSFSITYEVCIIFYLLTPIYNVFYCLDLQACVIILKGPALHIQVHTIRYENDMIMNKMSTKKMKVAGRSSKKMMWCMELMMMTVCLLFVNLGMVLSSMEWNSWMKMVNGNRLQYVDLCYQNIPLGLSTANKESVIELILDRHRPHVLGVAEPRASELSTMHFPGYSLLQGIATGINDPRLNVLVKDGLTVEFLPFQTMVPSLLLKIQDTKVLMTYREWSYDGDTDTQDFDLQEERWETFVDKWKRLRGRVIAMGDFNYEYWRQETPHHARCLKMKNAVLENIIPRGYTQCVMEDMRFQGKQRGCLDHVYTNHAQFIDRVLNKSVAGYDHNMISVRLMLRRPAYTPKRMEVRDIKNMTPEQFQHEFSLLDHDEFLQCQDVDDMVTVLVKNITKVLDRLAPKRMRTFTTRHARYLTPELRQEMKDRDHLRRMAEITGDQEAWKTYKSVRNSLRKKLEKTKKDYLQKLVEEADSKNLWRIVKDNSGLQTKKSSAINLRVDGEVLKEPQKVAEHLSGYYIQKVQKIVDEHPPDPVVAKEYTDRYVKGKVIKQMDFTPVSVDRVISIVRSLKSTGAAGSDGISCILLKKVILSVAFFLTTIINTSLLQAKYPTSFKHGVISPVPKPGDPLEDKSWRPVVILSALSKPLERVINQQLKDHLIDNGLLSQEQHAYQAMKSTSTA